jgi:hypothetical protein
VVTWLAGAALAGSLFVDAFLASRTNVMRSIPMLFFMATGGFIECFSAYN